MSPIAPGFAALKAKKLFRLLERELGYRGRSTGGSHRVMKAPGRPTVTFAFHDKEEVGPHMVRRILTQQVGLTLEEAKEVVKRA